MPQSLDRFLANWRSAMQSGAVDGLFVPHEGVRRARDCLGPVSRQVRHRQGELYLRTGAWAHFGHSSLEEFSSAFRQNRVALGSINHRLALGTLSCGDTNGIGVGISFSDVPWSLFWECSSASEAIEVAEAIEKICPQAQPVVTRSWSTRLLAGSQLSAAFHGGSLFDWLRTVPAHLRLDLSVLVFAGIAMTAAAAGAIVTGQTYILPINAGLASLFLLAIDKRCKGFRPPDTQKLQT